MGTEKSVGDERRKLTAEELGKIQKKTNEIVKRIEEGVIFFDDALSVMQDIIEGKSRRLRLGLIPKVAKKWREKNDVIYFKVTSDGATGEQWIERLEKKGFKLSKNAKELLLSKDFKTTISITYEIAVLKGRLFTESNRITEKIRSEAVKRKLVTPNPEVACLIREMFSDDKIKAMGLGGIVTFHKPIKDSGGDLDLLGTEYDGNGSWLIAYYDYPNSSWSRDRGFAFEVLQASL